MANRGNKMKGWLPQSTWNKILKEMPIPCVDIICINVKGEILYGKRIIKPYQNVWALIGGRVLRGESPKSAALRNLAKYGIHTKKDLTLNGVFNVNFGWRSDISTSFIAQNITEPTNTGKEFFKFEWKRNMPTPIGGMYRKMIEEYLDRFI